MRALSICVALLSVFFVENAVASTSEDAALISTLAEKVRQISERQQTGRETPEDRQLLLQLRQIVSGQKKPTKSSAAAKDDGILKRGQREYQQQHGIVPPAPKQTEVDDFCNPKRNLYIRADRLDTYLYGITPLDNAKGASVNYTNDNVTGHRTTNITGGISYVLFREICRDPSRAQIVNEAYLSGLAIAPWVYANGSLNNFNPRTEQSALKYGLDNQYGWIGGPLFDAQYLTLSPYYQTDFRSRASVYGFTASWQPQLADWHLGGVLGKGNDYLYWYWQFNGEIDLKKVNSVGLTNLAGGEYEWFGFATRLHLFLLPVIFNHRLHADGTYQAYVDARSSQTINKYVASLAYNFTDDGNASISIEYDRGTDIDTLVYLNQYLVKLNVKY